MADAGRPDLYGLIDNWLGLGLEFRSRDRHSAIGHSRWDELLMSYVESRDYDPVTKCSLGLPVEDRFGELHVHVSRREGPWPGGLSDSANDALRRSLLYAHGVILDSHLMHHLARHEYAEAARELELMGQLRGLASVGAVRWREPPLMHSDYMRSDEGRTVRLPAALDLRDLLPMPGPFTPGFDSADPNLFRFDLAADYGDLISNLQVLAPAGTAVLAAPPAEAGLLVDSWMRHLATAPFPHTERMRRETAELVRLLSRFPHLVDGQAPTTSTHLMTLCRLRVHDQSLELDDAVRLRRDSDRFASWRQALQAALSATGKETAGVTDPQQWQRTAMTVMQEHLGPPAAALKVEMRALGPVKGLTSLVASTLGMTAATAAAGGSPIEAAAGAAGGAFGVVAARAVQGRRDRLGMKAELAHFMAFTH